MPSTIVCLLSNSSISYGSDVRIFGEISARVSSTVKLWYSTDGANWDSLANVVSGADGSYSQSWAGPKVGNYLIRASWDGNEDYEGSTSGVVSLTIVKGRSEISLQSARTTITRGEEIEVSGSTTPSSASINITVNYRKPNGASITHSVRTDTNGRFSDNARADLAGNWRVEASWPGNEHYEGSSTSIDIKVNPNIIEQMAPFVLPAIIVALVIILTSRRRRRSLPPPPAPQTRASG